MPKKSKAPTGWRLPSDFCDGASEAYWADEWKKRTDGLIVQLLLDREKLHIGDRAARAFIRARIVRFEKAAQGIDYRSEQARIGLTSMALNLAHAAVPEERILAIAKREGWKLGDRRIAAVREASQLRTARHCICSALPEARVSDEVLSTALRYWDHPLKPTHGRHGKWKAFAALCGELGVTGPMASVRVRAQKKSTKA